MLYRTRRDTLRLHKRTWMANRRRTRVAVRARKLAFVNTYAVGG